MTIGELTRATGVSARSLRHYEAGGLLKPRRRGSGYRDYDDEDLDRVQRIRDLIALGLTLRQIRPVLELGASSPLGLVEAQLVRVDHALEQLMAQRERLLRLCASLDSGRPSTSEDLLIALEIMSMLKEQTVDPVVLAMDYQVYQSLDFPQGREGRFPPGHPLLVGLKAIRKELAEEEGFRLCGVRMMDRRELTDYRYQLEVFGKLVASGTLRKGEVLLTGPDFDAVEVPELGIRGEWVREQDIPTEPGPEVRCWTALEVMLANLKRGLQSQRGALSLVECSA
jgi:DNA-binding transcriptional MerR regulator